MREQDIEDLFARARAQEPPESGALLARVFADALDLQPRPLPAVFMRQPKLGLWASIVDTLGGKGALAGLGTAAAFGVLLGFVQPTSLMTLTDSLFAQSPLDDVDLIPGVDAILTEG